ncbi:hypothetical protein MINTM018_53050 (plasmid) [Mycobacterium intracellulare]|uniref:Uncharacterized protein n=1 Tax=Mycobacterium intracellulare TaxID=1767 RepID=A0A7R7MYX2_MYCIT|nr:hypothetical protein MINTM018_53050 [Mycobacterium intracellulare]
MPLLSKTDASELQGITELRQAFQAAGLALDERQEQLLVSLVTARDLPAALQFTQKQMRFYTVTEAILKELLSISLAALVTPARSSSPQRVSTESYTQWTTAESSRPTSESQKSSGQKS